MIKGFHHAAISTSDLERSVAFYRDVVGCEEAWRMDWQQGSADADALTGLKDSAARAVMMKLGETFLEIFEYESPHPRHRHGDRPVCDHGITHICLEVEDIQAEYERMKAAGMRFHAPPLTQPGSSLCYGRDIDGNVVELIEFEQ